MHEIHRSTIPLIQISVDLGAGGLPVPLSLIPGSAFVVFPPSMQLFPYRTGHIAMTR